MFATSSNEVHTADRYIIKYNQGYKLTNVPVNSKRPVFPVFHLPVRDAIRKRDSDLGHGSGRANTRIVPERAAPGPGAAIATAMNCLPFTI